MSGGGFEDDELYDDEERFKMVDELQHAGEKKEEKIENPEAEEKATGSGLEVESKPVERISSHVKIFT